jgi:hypothetical protein
MTFISYHGRTAALAGRDRFYLAPWIAQRPDGDPVKRFVCVLVLYARDVALGMVPGDPLLYQPARGERYARECMLPERDFRARAHRNDHELAKHFGVPLEQIAARRVEISTGLPAPTQTRRRPCSPRVGALADQPRRAGRRSRKRTTPVCR